MYFNFALTLCDQFIALQMQTGHCNLYLNTLTSDNNELVQPFRSTAMRCSQSGYIFILELMKHGTLWQQSKGYRIYNSAVHYLCQMHP